MTLTMFDIIAIAIACKLWSLITDILAVFIVDWKDSRKKPVDNNQVVDIIHKTNNKIPTSVPPPLKRGVVDVNIRMK